MRLLAIFTLFVSPAAWVTAAAPSAGELARTPASWPAETSITRSTRATVLTAGKPAGAMLLGAGRMLAVTGISADRVTGRIGSTEVEVPLDCTDVLARATPVSAADAAPAVQSAAPPGAPAPTLPAPPQPAPRNATPSRPARAIPDLPPTPLQTAFSDKLVAWQDGAVRPFDVRRLNGVKFYALYFSASWCGPCRDFTPELVRDYAALKQLYPEFELVFVSWDRAEADMHGYLRDDGMPWPALRYADRRLREVARHAGRGIPCLVLVDASGQELSHSYRFGRYVGPAQVVEDTWKILKEHRRTAARK